MRSSFNLAVSSWYGYFTCRMCNYIKGKHKTIYMLLQSYTVWLEKLPQCESVRATAVVSNQEKLWLTVLTCCCEQQKKPFQVK